MGINIPNYKSIQPFTIFEVTSSTLITRQRIQNVRDFLFENFFLSENDITITPKHKLIVFDIKLSHYMKNKKEYDIFLQCGDFYISSQRGGNLFSFKKLSLERCEKLKLEMNLLKEKQQYNVRKFKRIFSPKVKQVLLFLKRDILKVEKEIIFVAPVKDISSMIRKCNKHEKEVTASLNRSFPKLKFSNPLIHVKNNPKQSFSGDFFEKESFVLTGLDLIKLKQHKGGRIFKKINFENRAMLIEGQVLLDMYKKSNTREIIFGDTEKITVFDVTQLKEKDISVNENYKKINEKLFIPHYSIICCAIDIENPFADQIVKEGTDKVGIIAVYIRKDCLGDIDEMKNVENYKIRFVINENSEISKSKKYIDILCDSNISKFVYGVSDNKILKKSLKIFLKKTKRLKTEDRMRFKRGEINVTDVYYKGQLFVAIYNTYGISIPKSIVGTLFFWNMKFVDTWKRNYLYEDSASTLLLGILKNTNSMNLFIGEKRDFIQVVKTLLYVKTFRFMYNNDD